MKKYLVITMNKFMEVSHDALNKLIIYDRIHVVLGNESCDLDSAISSLVYAYFLYKHFYSPCNATACIAIPVLNIVKDDFPLRTETRYFLEKNNITLNNLTFRDQIDLLSLNKDGKLIMTLVDHHVLPVMDQLLMDKVVEVIDHRPIDKSAKWTHSNVIINPVGSCCTLVAKQILDKRREVLNDDLARLLHGTIVLDTVNFNEEANRFKQLDKDIAQILENQFEILGSREEIYKELVDARSDISSLTPYQVLHRDMKMVNGVPFPGVPMLFEEFMKLPQAFESLQRFCQTHKVKVIVPMGLVTRGDLVYRDIAVYAYKNCKLKEDIIRRLRNDVELKLDEIKASVEGLIIFRQENVKMSRKHIIPLVRSLIEECSEPNGI